MNSNTFLLVVLLLAGLVVFVAGVSVYFILFRIWFKAYIAQVPVSLGRLIGMLFRKVSPRVIIGPCVSARAAGVTVGLDDLEARYQAGGGVLAAVAKFASAKEAGRKEDVRAFSAKDLKGHEV